MQTNQADEIQDPSRSLQGKLLFRVVIPGRPYVKKNTGKVVRLYSGRTTKISSQKFKAWEQSGTLVILQKLLKHPMAPISKAVHVRMKFFFKDRGGEPDLSNLLEGPADLLKKCRVITDDRIIESFDGSRKVFGNSDPRTEIEIYEFKE